MKMQYRWLLVVVLATGCWLAYAYMPNSSIVRDASQVVGEMKAVVRIPAQGAEIAEIKASLAHIEELLATHVASCEVRFAKIERELERREK